MSSRFAEVSVEQIERVRMMRDRFLEGGRFSFNYNVLLLVASVLAALGIVSNNSTTIIASMLVSPIMGPVVAMAYGTTIFDWRMIRVGLVTELVTLVLCIVIGAIIGLCTGRTALADEWPTHEMAVRGDWQNFYVALPVAFFSGLGVAVSLLDDQANSLVGVAISASLLPPAVNAGIVWVAYGFVDEEDRADAERSDYREAGVVSLLLTLSNIALIWLASVLMFRIKEVSATECSQLASITTFSSYPFLRLPRSFSRTNAQVLPIKKKPFWSVLKKISRAFRHSCFKRVALPSRHILRISVVSAVVTSKTRM